MAGTMLLTIGIGPKCLSKRSGVGPRQHRQGGEAIGVMGRHHPRHGAAPVVANEVEAPAWLGAGCIRKREDISHQAVDAVVRKLGGVGASLGRITTLIRCHRTVTGGRQRRHLLLPRVTALGKAVQEHYQWTPHGTLYISGIGTSRPLEQHRHSGSPGWSGLRGGGLLCVVVVVFAVDLVDRVLDGIGHLSAADLVDLVDDGLCDILDLVANVLECFFGFVHQTHESVNL